MGQAVGQVLPLAVAVALSPLPIIGVVLILATPHGRMNSAAFLLGAVAGVAAVTGGLLLAANAGDASDGGAPADWVSVGKLVLGFLLLRFAWSKWRARPRAGEVPELPAWMQAVDTLTPAKAAGLGVLLAAVNPKNLVLLIAGAAAIAQTGAGSADQTAALAVFVAVACAGVWIPVLLSAVLGARAQQPLEGLRDWMARESATIIAVICVLIAAKLIGDAIGGLAG